MTRPWQRQPDEYQFAEPRSGDVKLLKLAKSTRMDK